MNSKNKSVLNSLFINPIPADILWKDIENTFISLGAEISEGQGSRVRVKLNDVRAVFHRPHPKKVTDKGAVKSVRKFLENAGIKND
ncbi:MAG: type II toxin-antitoxin system HicA family toxin [Leptospira sp.]|nr:type II toxin-antitoxin system HicA family toxin [Leptospira sp.]